MGAYEFQGTTLPVILQGFTGTLQNGVANLQWHTGVETGFNHFELQKGTDSKNYTEAATLAAKGSNSYYTYIIPQPEPIAYYRLKMVDNDGSATYSNVVTLSQNSTTDMLLYPNPSKDHINISTPDAGSISIYNTTGDLMKIQILQPGVNIIDINTFAPGVYYGIAGSKKMKFIKE